MLAVLLSQVLQGPGIVGNWSLVEISLPINRHGGDVLEYKVV